MIDCAHYGDDNLVLLRVNRRGDIREYVLCGPCARERAEEAAGDGLSGILTRPVWLCSCGCGRLTG